MMQTTLWRRMAAIFGVLLALAVPTVGLAQGGSPNDMIRGGVSSTSEVIADLHAGDGAHSAQILQEDYAATGVTVHGLQTYTAHSGYVTKSGQVVLNDSGKVVATNA